MPTFRSLRREKIELRIGRTKETQDLLVESLQPQDLGLETAAHADVQEIDALKALKDPAHGGTLGRLVHLIGNRLLGGSQLGAKQVLS